MARFYRNTGKIGGYIAETDNGKKLHVPSTELGTFREALNQCIKYKGERKVGTTKVRGFSDHTVTISDKYGDSENITDGHANKILNEVDNFILKEKLVTDSLNLRLFCPK